MLPNLKNKISKLSILLFGGIVVLALYTVNTTIKYNRLTNVFQIEYKSLEKEIDEIIADYDKIIKDVDTELSEKIKKRRSSIISLKNSIANINTNNYSSLNHYRNKIRLISKQNRKLFATIDSLKLSNEILKSNNIVTTIIPDSVLEEHRSFFDNDVEATVTPRLNCIELKGTKKRFFKTKKPIKQHNSLYYKIIRVESLMKDETSNEYIPTYKFDKVSAFKVSLEILKNRLVKSGKKEIFVQVIDEDNEVIRPLSNFKLHEVSALCTDRYTINYSNENLSVSFLLKFDDGTFNKEGNYLLVIYTEGEFVCNRIITLS